MKARRSSPRDDLISALVEAHEAGDRLSEDELVSMIFLLLIAGHETTVNLIGNGVLALLEHPEAMARLRDDPSLIKPAVEELLRYDGPLATATERFAREDVTIDGVTIPRGEMVLAVLSSANRDDRQFERPDALDLTREPNRHLAFGLGVHYCLGAPLARLEGQIAINTLLRRAPTCGYVSPRIACDGGPGCSSAASRHCRYQGSIDRMRLHPSIAVPLVILRTCASRTIIPLVSPMKPSKSNLIATTRSKTRHCHHDPLHAVPHQ